MAQVSVIMPNFNNAVWLSRSIESCIEQGEFLKELIVVDDNSTDDSWQILEKYARVHPQVKIFRSPGKGANDARNFGFLQSTGNYIQWLDSDDIILPGKFRKQVEAFECNAEINIVYSDWQMNFYDRAELVKSETKILSKHDDYLYQLIINNWTCPHNYLLKRSVAELLHIKRGWNPKTQVEQDREYFTLAGIYGSLFYYVPGIYSIYNRWSQSSISSMNFKKRLERSQNLMESFKVHMKNSPLPEYKIENYLRALDTQLIANTFYSSSLKPQTFTSLWNLDWKIVNKKLRPLMPILYFLTKIRNVISKNQIL